MPNYFDIAVLVILLVFALRGGMRGFIEEMAGLIGLAAGLLLAKAFFTPVSDALAAYIAPSAAPAVAFVALTAAGMIGVAIVARLLRALLDFAFASWLDRLLGVAAGLFKGFLLCVLAAYAVFLLAPQFPFVQTSVAMPTLLDAARWIITTVHVDIPLP